MACQSVFCWKSGEETLKMPTKVASKHCIYWFFFAFSFFLWGGCKSTGSDGLAVPLSGSSGTVLYTKSVRKWNPRFFEEGSAYHSFVEVSGDPLSPTVWRTDVSFSIRDADFLKSVQSFFPKSSMKKYRIHLFRFEGNLKKATNADTIEVVFKQFYQTESEANDLVTLLKQLGTLTSLRLPINESALFRQSSRPDEFTLGTETINLSNGSSLEWNYEFGALGGNVPTGEFKSSSDLNFQSSSYDSSKIQFEKFSMEPEKFYFKSIWKSDKQDIFFIPTLANASRFLNTEPIEFKRFGNFLIKEENL